MNDPQNMNETQSSQETLPIARILESITDAFFALDTGWHFTYLNAQAERLLLRTRAALLGKTVWDEFPEAVGSTFEREYRRAVADQVTVTFEEFFAPLATWFEVRAFPSPDGLSVFFHNINERVERRKRERFLAELAERSRRLTEPDEVIADAVRSVGQFLGVSRCVFADLDLKADTCTIPPDYRADDTIVSMAGTFPISAFGHVLVAAYAAGRAIAVDDVRADPAQVPPENVSTYDAVGIRAHIGVPVVHSDRLVSCIGVHSPVPRHWTPEEVELLQAVVERTWLTVEVTRQEQALVREAKELRESEERYRLLVESTGEGFYGIGLDGSFTFVNRAAERMLRFTQAEIIGRSGHRLIHHTRPDGSLYPEDECPIYHALHSGEPASIEDDVFWRSDGTAFSVAYSAAPILEDGTVRGVVVTFSDISERKALEAERAELAEREHRIAEQLQAALQPPMPESVPGLKLADYYRPAWEDQGVGGDFVDVFSDDKGLTFLVVGDLSGKGLAAASQVATVRNMLRFALYNGRSVVGPVMALNSTLADHNLLTGFTTLFVGRYDAAARVLTYVNCGQDAGLVLRASSGKIETLPPTGPVLGAISRAVYVEEAISLEARDVLALYTDGLTEAGPSRTALLTGDGVADLLVQLTGIVSPQAIVERLMAGIDTFAGTGIRDDQCLLVGVVA